jgi:hypothetical protein
VTSVLAAVCLKCKRLAMTIFRILSSARIPRPSLFYYAVAVKVQCVFGGGGCDRHMHCLVGGGGVGCDRLMHCLVVVNLVCEDAQRC